MSRRTRQRINYVLPLSHTDAAGHRLGVNGLCIDQKRSTLYSAGRDGVICAWSLDERRGPDQARSPGKQQRVPCRKSTQAHTDWINDLVLVQNNEALVSASSDCSVKVWRPHAAETTPQTIGLHNDYVKCLASPSSDSSWVASGGLDRKICLWDLGGAGVQSQIEVADPATIAKGSVYGLAANNSLIASGGPECIVKLWDPRTAKSITRFVGHTDMIRSILISEDSDVVMTASSDRTVKLWSVTAGRCMCTLGMHNDSVWSLWSDHPQLSVFYSGDKSGFVAKTDMRSAVELEDGLSVALCRETDGICRLSYTDGYVWTATASSSINCWTDADTTAGFHIPDTLRPNRSGIISRNRTSTSSHTHNLSTDSRETGRLPLSCVLRLPTNAGYPYISGRIADRAAGSATANPRKVSYAVIDPELGSFVPLRSAPDTVIEGQNGLIKHVILNDKRRVLAMDSAGEVTMWNLITCNPIQSFGKRDLESVTKEVNTPEYVDSWCTIDTRTGTLSCILDGNYCFDAEVYADELPETQGLGLKDDQRINLGKWILRYLFSDLVDEELRRDELYRQGLSTPKNDSQAAGRLTPPRSIQLPHNNLADLAALPTPRAGTNSSRTLATPGLSIGAATPVMASKSPALSMKTPQVASPTSESGPSDRKLSTQSQGERPSLEKTDDYFSSKPNPGSGEPATQGTQQKGPVTPSDSQESAGASPNPEGEKAKDTPTSLGKRLRMPFGSIRFGRSPAAQESKTAATDEKSEDSDSKSSAADDKKEDIFQDRLLGTVHRIRDEYNQRPLGPDGTTVDSAMNPCLVSETPSLKLPPNITVVIQEERADTAGVMDVFEGSLNELGSKADLLEKVAPYWLADFLLRNRVPPKENKVAFTLEPWKDTLPYVTSSDGTERLTANRVLRAKKVLAYVAERLETPPSEPDPSALKPEEYLELYCQNQLIPPTMTLATIRSHIWRGGGDVVLVYKSNGRKQIAQAQEPVASSSESSRSAAASSEAGSESRKPE